jgi:hypothetical protein
MSLRAVEMRICTHELMSVLTRARLRDLTWRISFDDFGIVEADLAEAIEASKFLSNLVERYGFDLDGTCRGPKDDVLLGV